MKLHPRIPCSLWPVWLCSVFLVACATVAGPPPASSLFDDSLFGPPSERIAPSEIMAISDDMRRYIATDILPVAARRDLRRMLVDALYNRDELLLDYEGGETRTAAQAFHDRAGNCLSLVLMTAAFAKELGLSVQFQRVVVEDAWSREGNLFFASGHVNLTLGPVDQRTTRASDANQALTVDFLPAEQIRGQRVRAVSERTVLAMFMNNRAAEALARGSLADAYAWARAAIERDPGFYDAYNTLGVIYLRSGHQARAERVFSSVLAREPGNTKVMSNMLHVLQRMGRADEARLMAKELARLQPVRPFQLFDAGVDAMLHGNYKRARELFAEEVKRESSYHEFHFWLALANFGLGDVDRARKHMKLAKDWSATPGQHDLYAAKLDRLRSHSQR